MNVTAIHKRDAAMAAAQRIPIAQTQQLHQLPQEAPQPHQPAPASAVAAAISKLMTDEHATPQHHLTHIQITLLIVYVLILTLWICRTICSLLNIRIFNNLPGFGSGSNSNSNSSLLHSGNTKTQGDQLTTHALSSSTITLFDDAKNEKIINQQYERLSEKDRNTNGTENGSNSNSLELKGVVTPNGKNIPEGIKNNNSAVITVGQTGVTENLSERQFNNSDKRGISDKDNNVSSVPSNGDDKNKNSSTSASSESAGKPASSSGPPPVTFDLFLRSFVLFGAIMIFFYFCDYWKMFPQGPRVYSRDVFCFLVFLFFLVASAFTIKDNPDKVLNRDQTEEWKGWMQVMFVWYHYFKASEWYNWIRVYIACYVWMTGFGNFSFFWIRKDFSMWRMLKMLFRLNFLVAFVAMVTNNEYMLYYICAMHTYWFLTVYVFMRVLNSWNTHRYKMAAKFVAYAVCNAIIFDIPGVGQEIFRPFKLILGYHDYNNKFDVMHEWAFRAGLDHWACFIGMLCAYNYPHFEALMSYLDSKSISKGEQQKKLVMRVGLGAGAFLVGLVWNRTSLQHDKYAYNAQHPYTSGIPILVFIVLRNIHPVIRSKHIGMFSWLGKITLETYLSQLHIYLLANARTLLLYLPDYPLLNFALATIVYLVISNLLFNITNDASNFLIPRDRKRLVIHIVCTIALFGFASVVAYGAFA